MKTLWIITFHHNNSDDKVKSIHAYIVLIYLVGEFGQERQNGLYVYLYQIQKVIVF